MLRPVVEVLEQYGLFGLKVSELGTGLINQTWKVETDCGQTLVLQCVNNIFPASVTDDIAAVTNHLRDKGVLAPEIIPAYDGELSVEYAGDDWRLMKFVDGVSYDGLSSVEQAKEAGAALATFHCGVADLQMQFSHQRPHVHDTSRHLAALEQALKDHADHPRFVAVEPLAQQILKLAGELPVLPDAPQRLVHGDPKISNLLFDEAGQAMCWVDLDTLAYMALPLEMGDAFRSWCNPTSEDSSDPEFRADYFAAAARGYAEVAGDFVTAAEWQSFIDGTQTILVELSARFCADALNESYFGWDASRFASRSEHNEVRARNQLQVLESMLAQRADLNAALNKAFA